MVAGTQMVTPATADDATISSASLLQAILAKFAERDPSVLEASASSRLVGDIGAGTPAHAGANSTAVGGNLVQPTPRTEFSRRVKPVGMHNMNNLSMELSQSQDWTSTSTMNSTQDSTINPLMSFGSPPSKMSPAPGSTLPRMHALSEEGSLLSKSGTSPPNLEILPLRPGDSLHGTQELTLVRLSGLEVLHLPQTDALGKCDCYLEVRCGAAQGRTKAVRNSYTAVFDEVLTLPVADLVPHDEIVVVLREWERMGSSKTLASASIPLEPLRRNSVIDTSAPLFKAGGLPMMGYDGVPTQVRVRVARVLSGGDVTMDSAVTMDTATPPWSGPSAKSSTPGDAARARDNQRLLDGSDEVTRDLFQSALAPAALSPQRGTIAQKSKLHRGFI